MTALTFGFVGGSAEDADGRACAVWASHAPRDHRGSSPALERVALDVLAKHANDPPGTYRTPLETGQAVITLVRDPGTPSRHAANPMIDATPLPSERGDVEAARPRPAPAPPTRVVFGAVVSAPEDGGPSVQHTARWLERLADAWYLDASPTFAAFSREIEAAAPSLRAERDVPASSSLSSAAAAAAAPSARVSKLDAANAKMREVRLTMVDNIARVIDRGEKLDDVLAKSDGLRTTADAFHRTARRLRSRMWWANVRTALAVFLVALAGVVVIFFAACGGVRCVT